MAVALLSAGAWWWPGVAKPANPFLDRAPYLVPGEGAQQALANASGADRELLHRLAQVPTAVWLTPEGSPRGEAGKRVATLVAEAGRADRTAVFVVYGIPGRDCAAGHSAGGLTPVRYLQWIAEIAVAAGRTSVVVLEPDALALAEECGGIRKRAELLADAVRTLASRDVTTYLDAGHANWIGPGEMARRLRLAGVDSVRGFAVNVSNYDLAGNAHAYATAVRSRLGTHTHFVIDTGRGGAGVGDTWCNPAGRALGPEPRAFEDSPGLDAWLWIKPPGESDGTCQGGPPAGEWWTARAVELARNAGW